MKYEIRPADRYRFGFKELWEYRELFYYFTWRDIKVRYKQTFLGAAWAVLQPLILTGVFTFFFAHALPIETGPLPYHLFAFSGMMTWGFFSSGLSNSASSLLSASNIIRKIYFPRLILPVSAILAAMMDLAITFLLMVVLVLIEGRADRLPALFVTLPCTVALSTMTMTGAGCFLAALNVKYRDFRYVIPFALQVLFFLSPVIYPSSMLPDGWVREVVKLNPVGTSIEITRNALSGAPFDGHAFLLGGLSSLLLLLTGLFYFRKTEYYFADLA